MGSHYFFLADSAILFTFINFSNARETISNERQIVTIGSAIVDRMAGRKWHLMKSLNSALINAAFFSSFQYAVQQPEAVICDRSSPQPSNLSIHHLSAYTFDSCILMNFIDFSKPRTRQFTRVYPLEYACSLARSYSGVVTAVAGRQIYYLRHDFYFALHCCLQRVRSFG